MRLGQQEELPVDGIAQFGQAPVAKLRQQHHAVGLQLADHPRATGNQLVRPAIFRLMGHEANLAGLQLLAQPGWIEHFDLRHHDLDQQLLQAQPHRALFFLVVAVPMDDFMVEALAATAHQITVNSGAKADAGGLDGLIGHGQGSRGKAKQVRMLALCLTRVTPEPVGLNLPFFVICRRIGLPF